MADLWLSDLEKGARSAADQALFNGYARADRGFGRVRVKFAKRDRDVSYYANGVQVTRSYLLRLDHQFPLAA